MALDTPTTAEIRDNIVAQIQAALNQTIPLLPKAFIRVLAAALAAVFILLYKYGGFIFLQVFVQTATNDATTINGVTVSPLTAWGRLIGVGNPTAATRAELTIDVIVQNQTGTLPAGSQLVNASTGVTYITLATIALDAAVKAVDIRAGSDQSGGGGRGAIGNMEVGAVVSFANPLANVAQDTTVTVVVVTAADGEAVEAYRQRVIDRFQKRPQGGAYSDYEQWAEETPGIINAYPYTGAPGQVDVYNEATEASSGSPDGIPTAAQLLAVLDNINFDQDGLPSRRPANAFPNALAITRTGFTATVGGLVVDNPAQVQTDITAAIVADFLAFAPFIDGLSVLPRQDRISQAGIAGTVEDVVTAAGGIFQTVTLKIGFATINLYLLGEGEKSKASNVVFI